MFMNEFFWSPFLKIGITLTRFKIYGKISGEKDKLIRSDIGLSPTTREDVGDILCTLKTKKAAGPT